MNSYLWLKLLHILSAVVVTGTGVGIAFFLIMAHRANNAQVFLVTVKHVIIGDWVFTTPAIITLLVTGAFLMDSLGYSFRSTWFYWVASLFIAVVCCWVIAVRIQYRLRKILDTGADLSAARATFKRMMRAWLLLGILAFSAILIIFWLMIFKPFPVFE